ncbi:phosphatidylserine synthase I, putative [Plasmodium gallinaceum]|uniref:Phosphatidylserine synthase I, putative n=1 Tax=Plasmodium gallinaceum TaxID=5849 RepID=A0A1J1GNJ2_PLAGA|nr:phosphatidylserine synthase I, putative [Plasmodium gallinaceum]CRG94026.1 phosphatidylserine synthase I, putative [Plasmodium gallinaceum]
MSIYNFFLYIYIFYRRRSLYLLCFSLIVSLILSNSIILLEFKHRIIISLIISFFNLCVLKNVIQKIIFTIKKDVFTILINSVIIFYYVIIVFCQFFSPNEIKYIIKIFNKNIVFYTAEKSYMENCNSLNNITDKLDIFVIAHLLGWFIKGFAMRNFFLLNLNSVLFELLELRFQHLLPNFYECWWDHVILDVLGCNLIGIMLSIFVMKYFNIPFFDWTIPDKIKPKKKNLIFPTLDKLCRKVFKNSASLLLLIFYSIIVNIIDLNIFFLKAELNLYPTNYIIFLRTGLVVIICVKASIELHNCISREASIDGVFYVFIVVTIFLLELLLCVKWKHNLKSDNSDLTVINATWLLITSTFSSILLFLYANECLI